MRRPHGAGRRSGDGDVSEPAPPSGSSANRRFSPQDWSLRVKLAIALLVPSLIAVVLGGLRVADQAGEAAEFDRIAQVVERPGRGVEPGQAAAGGAAAHHRVHRGRPHRGHRRAAVVVRRGGRASRRPSGRSCRRHTRRPGRGRRPPTGRAGAGAAAAAARAGAALGLAGRDRGGPLLGGHRTGPAAGRCAAARGEQHRGQRPGQRAVAGCRRPATRPPCSRPRSPRPPRPASRTAASWPACWPARPGW